MERRFIYKLCSFKGSSVTIGCALLLLVIACGFIQAQGAFAPFDRALMESAGSVRNGAGAVVTPFAQYLSFATDVPGRLVMLILLALWFVPRGQRGEWLWLACVAIAAMLLNMALKHGFQAPRPDMLDHLDPTKTFSFPSGHASGSMAFFGGLALVAASRVVWSVAALLILLIGMSRVWLGVHWPSDVICGWIEGIAILVIASRWIPTGKA